MPPFRAPSSVGAMAPLVIALFAALVPPLVAWSTGRRRARATDDPLLPELLLARERREAGGDMPGDGAHRRRTGRASCRRCRTRLAPCASSP